MADALSILRQFTVEKKLKDVVEKEDQIIFGDFAWSKTAKTNYLIWGTGKDGNPKDYYTLDCILFLLKNVNINHATYVKHAAEAKVQIVRRPDRKDLLSYVTGEISTSVNIDKSAPIEISLQRPTQVKRTAEETANDLEKKKPRIEDGQIQRERERLARKLDPQSNEASVIPTQNTDSSLYQSLSVETISAIRAKIIARKRTTIKGDETDAVDLPLSAVIEGVRGTYTTDVTDVDVMRDVVSKERNRRTRSTVLQSTGKEFMNNIFGILQVIKIREEGGSNKNQPPTNSTNAPPSRINAANPYSRYDQEIYNGSKGDTAGFNIETMDTFHGMTLKSVTEGTAIKKPTQNVNNKDIQGPGRPVAQTRPPANQKKSSKTAIIIIPSAPSSIINMYNAKELLQDLKYVSAEEKKAQGMKRDNEILLNRPRPGSVTVPYRVIENPTNLTPEEWDRVVGVFVQGQGWQFKGWPWGGNPVEIFSKIKGFHLKWVELPTDANVLKWSVQILKLDRHKRHLDRAELNMFWEIIDKHMAKNKPHLRN